MARTAAAPSITAVAGYDVIPRGCVRCLEELAEAAAAAWATPGVGQVSDLLTITG
jgi:osmotically-inducible protein OsmY